MAELPSWIAAAPVLLVAIGWCLLPGLLVAYTAGLRGVTAWGTAPVVSIGTVAVAAIAAGRLGVPWSGWVAVTPAIGLAASAAVAGLVVRGRTPRTSSDPWAVAVAGAAGLAIAAAIGVGTAAAGMGTVGTVSQTYDAVFHYNAVARLLATGNASSLVVGTLNVPGSLTSFYPAAWHDLVSLVVISTGTTIPIASNVVAAVVAAVVWPLACLALVRQIVGPSWLAAVAAPTVAVGFIAFPWSLMSYGVLWPNLLGLSLIPIGLAAVIAVCGLGRGGSLTRGPAIALLPIVAVTLGLAHPNTLISLAVLSIPPATWWFGRWMRSRILAGRPVGAVAAAAAVLAATVGLGMVLLTSPLFDGVRAFDWPAFISPAGAVGEVALGATNGKSAAWAIAAVVLVGLASAWRRPDTRWLVPSHAISGTLYVLAASLETPLAAALTGFWYNDSYRLAAMIPITGVPLAVLGVIAIGKWAYEVAGRMTGTLPTPAAVGALATAVLVLASSGMYARDHAEFLDDGYRGPPFALVSPAEATFFDEVRAEIDPTAVVAQNPWSGSPMLLALTGQPVLFPHMAGEWTTDQLLLARHLRDAATDDRICPTAEELGVRYLLVGNLDFWPWDGRVRQYGGLAAPESGFRMVLNDDSGNALYELIACGSTGTKPAGTD